MKELKINNLRIYEAVRSVPQAAQKVIQAGRLKGMTDVNPMWRIKVLTETFGLCGFGWRYEIVRQWLEGLGDQVEVKAFCNINLYVKIDGEWSEPIPGTGGSSFITMERSGTYVNDECYKMALTDAISVAAKALGVGADVYFAKDINTTKYAQQVAPVAAPSTTPSAILAEVANAKDVAALQAVWNAHKELQSVSEFKHAVSARKKALQS